MAELLPANRTPECGPEASPATHPRREFEAQPRATPKQTLFCSPDMKLVGILSLRGASDLFSPFCLTPVILLQRH